MNVCKESTVRAAFAFAIADLDCRKAELEASDAQARVERRIAKLLNAWLSGQVDAVVAWGLAELPAEEKLAKLDGPPIDDPGDLAEDLAKALEAAAKAGATEVSVGLGVELGVVPPAALDFARRRAGELVGKKWIDGEWIDNPNAKFRIDETLRADVQSVVTTAIEEGWSPEKLEEALRAHFEPWRAETIARTETGYAYGNAAAEVYAENDVDLLEILDGAGCLPEGHDDGAPLPSGTPGIVESGAQANGQIWTVEQYQEHIIGHPNCVRGTAVYIAPEKEAAA